MPIMEKKGAKWVGDSRVEVSTYEDTTTGRKFGRIVAGFAWPFIDKPGFLVAIAEDLEKDHSLHFSPRHYWILAESESLNHEELYRDCLRFRDELYVKTFLGDSDSPFCDFFHRFRDSSNYISLTKPAKFDVMDPNYVVQLVIKRTTIQKTLHFGEGRKLPGYLQFQGNDVAGGKLECFPPVAALGYALSELENTQPWDSSGFYQHINTIRRSRGKQQNIRRPGRG